MQWMKKNIRYFILSLFVFTNGLIISESALSGGPSGSRSSFISLILSIFVNKTVPPIEPEFIAVESISLKNHINEELAEGSTYYIPLGVTRRVSPIILPEKATDKSVTWTTSDPDVLEVYSGGYLEARSIGENVLITATPSKPDLAVSFYVTVHEKRAPETFTAHLENDDIARGTSTRLVVELSELEAREYDPSKLDYFSNNETIVTINEYGVIKAHNLGETTVGITGHPTTYTVSVYESETPIIYPTLINLDLPDSGLVYDKTPLNYTFDVENVTDPSLTFTSSNEAIAKIIKEEDQYYIYGTKVNGTATITAYLNTDFLIRATHDITINNVLPNAVTLNANKTEAGVGQTIRLTPTFSHGIIGKEDVPVTNQRAVFTSSDESIARVSNSNLDGIVLGLKQGTVTITATSASAPEVSTSITLKIIATPYINDSNFDDFQTFVRKALGHYFFFFIDGVFGFFTFYLFFKNKRIKKTLISTLSVGIFIAALSEVIQTFIPGRAGRFSDVLIDSAGYLTATLICYLIIYLYNRKKNKVTALL